jgi:hypothetical protein
MTSATAMPKLPIAEARRKADKVQQELEVAGAELSVATEAFERHLPPTVKKGDVAWAIGRNAAVEQKVQDAAQELEEVTELLREAQEQLDSGGR